MDILLNFYNMAEKNKYVIGKNFVELNDARGLILYEQKICKRIIGITSIGKWFIKIDSKDYLLEGKKSFFKIVNILEIPFDEIEGEIVSRFGSLIEEYDVRIIFPFYNIVEYAFLNMQSLYWFELAYSWYVMLTVNQKKNLIPVLNEIIANKRFSQKLHHRIQKEIDNVMMI